MLLLLVSTGMMAQHSDRDYIRRGNRLFRDSLFDKAQIQYQKAVEVNPRSPQAHYNLANALMYQDKAEEAMKELQEAAKLETTNKARRAMIYHNMGVIFQTAKQYREAVTAYKEALRCDPHNDETRYNYVLCLRQLKNQPPQDQNQNQDNDQNDKNQDKQDKQDKQDPQQNEDKKNEDKQEEKPQPDPNQMSQENAEQMLKAAMQDERNTQEKVKRAQQPPADHRLKKQW